MKLLLGTCLSACLLLTGCLSTDTRTNTTARTNAIEAKKQDAQGNEVTVMRTLSCAEPVAKISIAPMECKAARCSKVPQASGNLAVILQLSGDGIQDFSTLGDAMTTMLSSAIQQSGCFTLLDREAMAFLKQEMGDDYQPERADLVFTGAVTSLEYAKKKTGLLGGSFTLGGAFENTETTAKIGLDVRLLNTKSSAVEYSKTYQSDASNDNFSFGMFGLGGPGAAAGGVEFGGAIELEEAVRTVLNQSIQDLIRHAAKDQYTVTEKPVVGD